MFDTSINTREEFNIVLRDILKEVTKDEWLISSADEIMLQRLDSLCRKKKKTIADVFYDAEVERTGPCSDKVSSFSDYMNTLELIRVLYGKSKYEFAFLSNRDQVYYRNIIRKYRNVESKRKCSINTIMQFILPLGISPAMFFRLNEIIMYMNIDVDRIVHILDTVRELTRRGKFEILYTEQINKSKNK